MLSGHTAVLHQYLMLDGSGPPWTESVYMCGCGLQELAVAFGGLVVQFEGQFAAVASQMLEEEKLKDRNTPIVSAEAPGGWNVVTPGTGMHSYTDTLLKVTATSTPKKYSLSDGSHLFYNCHFFLNSC